jgi:hypothetical protein
MDVCATRDRLRWRCTSVTDQRPLLQLAAPAVWRVRPDAPAKCTGRCFFTWAALRDDEGDGPMAVLEEQRGNRRWPVSREMPPATDGDGDQDRDDGTAVV